MKRLFFIFFIFVFACSKNPTDINSQLIQAVKDGNLDHVKILIAKGADLNTTDDKGGTPLHWAAYYGRKEIAEFLIMHGANLYKKDRNGLTPIDVARLNRKKEMLELFEKYKK